VGRRGGAISGHEKARPELVVCEVERGESDCRYDVYCVQLCLEVRSNVKSNCPLFIFVLSLSLYDSRILHCEVGEQDHVLHCYCPWSGYLAFFAK